MQNFLLMILSKRVGERYRYMKNYINDKSENDIVKEIFQIIKNKKRYISYNELCDIIVQLGYWVVFRKNRKSILDYLDNHNFYFLFRQVS